MIEPVKVRIEFDIQWEVGSPPDDILEPWMLAEECFAWESLWNSREGLLVSFIPNGNTSLYHNFTDATRRTMFAIFCQQTDASNSGASITWTTGFSYTLESVYIDTDSAWTSPDLELLLSDVESPGGGATWFALEGEEEDDYRKWPQGTQDNIVIS